VLELWHTVKFENVLKYWPLGIAQGLLLESGLFSNDALRDLLTKTLDGRSVQRTFTAGTTDAGKA